MLTGCLATCTGRKHATLSHCLLDIISKLALTVGGQLVHSIEAVLVPLVRVDVVTQRATALTGLGLTGLTGLAVGVAIALTVLRVAVLLVGFLLEQVEDLHVGHVAILLVEQAERLALVLAVLVLGELQQVGVLARQVEQMQVDCVVTCRVG